MTVGITSILRCHRVAKRFPGYEPRPISWMSVARYVRQFEKGARESVFKMLESIQYLPKAQARHELESRLNLLLSRADAAGITRENIFILPASTKGSSSGEMVAFLRDANEKRGLGVTMFEGNTLALRAALRGASAALVVFVDDFIGSGKQFEGSYKGWKSAITSPSVTSILMAVVMCPEAHSKIRSMGVEADFAILHGPHDRFQTACLQAVGNTSYALLESYAREIQSAIPFGFENMGTLVVLYRNSNNNMPFLLRGTQGQRVWFGLFPMRKQLAPA